MSTARYRLASGALLLAIVVVGALGVLTATRVDTLRGPLAAVGPGPAQPAEVTASAATLSVAVAAQAAILGPINPVDPIAVAVRNGELREVRITDAKTGKAVAGVLEGDGHTWHSTAPLAYGGSYRLATTAIGEDQKETRGQATITTLSPAKTSAVSFVPAPTMGAVGVGQPLVVKFSRPVTDKAAAEQALQVRSSPDQPGEWYWMSATEAHYRPPTYWAAGSTITLTANVFGVDLGNKVFGQANRMTTVRIHDSWVAKADGATHQMHVYHNDQLVKTMPISLGSAKNPSHDGPHVVSDKRPSVIMDSCTYGVCEGDPGYYKEEVKLDLRISSDGEFVHSAPWSVRQQGRSNVSHGCVNLSPANAQWMFDNFGIGDVVEIAHSGGPILPVWDTYGDWVLPWPQWQAGRAAG